METKEKEPLEIVEEFYNLLTEHEVPEGWRLGNLPPKMTGEQAWALIYYLQEGPRLLPDHIERCGWCYRLIDSWGEHIEWVHSKEQRLCESCYQAERAFECCACDEHDCHEAPGRMAVVTEEVQGLSPGLYRITRWPFYADGMIEGYIYQSSFERIGEIPKSADTNGYPIGFLCLGCERKTGLSNTEYTNGGAGIKN